MHTDTRIIELHGLRVRNDGDKMSRRMALTLDHFRIDRAEIVFILGMRGAGKTPFHDAIESIYHAGEFEGDNLIIPQHKQDKPPGKVRKLWRAAGVEYHSQSCKTEHVPQANKNVLIYCDDPNEGGCPTGAEIINLVLERQHTMLVGTDPDRLQVTLRHFLRREAGRVLWLHEGKGYFEGSTSQFQARRTELCTKLQSAKSDSDAKFLRAILSA